MCHIFKMLNYVLNTIQYILNNYFKKPILFRPCIKNKLYDIFCFYELGFMLIEIIN